MFYCTWKCILDIADYICIIKDRQSCIDTFNLTAQTIWLDKVAHSAYRSLLISLLFSLKHFSFMYL